MGENQGMIWIILGVLVVAAAVIFLGASMSNTMIVSEAKVEAQAAMTAVACDGLNGGEYEEIGKFEAFNSKDEKIPFANLATATDYDSCVFSQK